MRPGGVEDGRRVNDVDVERKRLMAHRARASLGDTWKFPETGALHPAQDALRLLALLLTAALLVLFVLPASAALTRIEAPLLPADMQPIVPFDRAALAGSIDLTARSSRTAIITTVTRTSPRKNAIAGV
ncbi:hypothetical protein DFH09DRAFT_1309702 [Mycena vulgaris]|nr:hypothetical protein DFH09DRAFT_1309702 [Mycena vulgaris]